MITSGLNNGRSKTVFYVHLDFCEFAVAKLIKLAKIASVMHKPDHVYFIQSTCCNQSANDVSFVSCVIN